MEFMIGCNYWDSKHGTDMWRFYDHDVVEADLAALEKAGVKYMRVFPNWRDFQPILSLKKHSGVLGEYRMGPDETLLPNIYGIDEKMLDHFEDFCRVAEKHGMKLVVSILTGWMSGRLFCPPALENKNLITDPECLRWEQRFVRGFVTHFRNEPVIHSWDLGNECNCMGAVDNPDQAYVWTYTIANTIRMCDPTRIVSSGMHSLKPGINDGWRIKDQGELCDLLTTHPYPSKTINNDLEPYNGLRTTMLPTAQTEYYSGVGGRPAMIQESGTFSPALGCPEMAADFVRSQIYSAWANGLKGYLFWCGMEHLLLDKPPYTWCLMERELGLLNLDREPKPGAIAMRECGDRLEALPETKLPPKVIDAVVVTTLEQEQEKIANITYVLAKQAGLNVALRHCNYSEDIPSAKIYMLPSITGWAVSFLETWNKILHEVHENGATLYISHSSGHITTFDDLTGMYSWGMTLNPAQQTGTFKLGGEEIKLPFNCNREITLVNKDAEVLATSESGNIIYARHRYGKGWVYFLNFPVEEMMLKTINGFSQADELPYYRIYQEFAQEALNSKVVRSGCTFMGLTYHPCEDGSWWVTAINYDRNAHDPMLTVADGWKITYVNGDLHHVPKCDMLLIRVERA